MDLRWLSRIRSMVLVRLKLVSRVCLYLLGLVLNLLLLLMLKMLLLVIIPVEDHLGRVLLLLKRLLLVRSHLWLVGLGVEIYLSLLEDRHT
jgi:hypothetical protein